MKKNLLILLYVLSPVVLMLVLFQANPQKYQDASVLMSMVLGACGYTWFIWQFILSARPKFIEVDFGMDFLYRVHGVMAVIALALIFIHRFINEEAFENTFISTLGNVAFFMLLGISGITLLLMVTSFIHKIQPFRWIKKTADHIRFFRYEHYRLLHNLSIVALIFILLHVLRTSSAQASLLVFNVYIFYFIVAVLFYLYHKILKGFLLEDAGYLVKNVIQESPDMWRVQFESQNGYQMRYQPGQFGFFTFIGSGIKEEEHPFSLSSSPTDAYLSVTVKALGDFTSTLNQLQVGDKVLVEAPYGRFSYLNHPKEKEIVLIAGGVGITPMLSTLRYMKEKDTRRQVTLIWSMRQLSDYISRTEVEAIQQAMPNLTVIPVVSKEIHYTGEKGRLDVEKLQRLLLPELQSPHEVGYYVCGPLGLMESVVQDLKALGVPNKNIHYEKFSL